MDYGNARETILDLMIREEKKTGIALGHVHEYLTYTDGKKTAVVLLFNDLGDFLGAGTAIKSPTDKYNKEAGFRKAAARALRSITVHERKPNGKRVRLSVR